MLKIYSCIAYAHDLRLVALAAIICALASFAAINLLHYARKSSGQMRGVWLAVSAISTGFRHLGNALRGDACVYAGNSEWL